MPLVVGAEQVPLRVRIDPRDKCILDAVCASLCSEVFEMSESDGKAVIKTEWRKSSPSEGVVPEDLAVCVEAAADNCPVSIILVEEA